jgi:hypothetical protein
MSWNGQSGIGWPVSVGVQQRGACTPKDKSKEQAKPAPIDECVWSRSCRDIEYLYIHIDIWIYIYIYISV